MEGSSEKQRSRRGFASMDANKRREIASKGGKVAHERGTAHQFTSAEATEAGRKGYQSRLKAFKLGKPSTETSLLPEQQLASVT
jgi:general stress protein YciG